MLAFQRGYDWAIRCTLSAVLPIFGQATFRLSFGLPPYKFGPRSQCGVTSGSANQLRKIKKYERDSDGDDAREDPATEHIEAGGGDGDDADLLRTLETELEDLFGDIDYVEDVREDEVEEAAQRLEPQLIIQT